MASSSFFWHDYETFGTDPQRDRASQFAGIRTDLDFNPIGEPLMAYCKLADDYLPHPEACLITGITPWLTQKHGVCEAEFIRLIHQQLTEPGTCGVGYNSIRFDDEVTRNLLYRNFYDPYAREWQNGNSRWDLIDIARAARALRPEGIEWPVNAEGIASFRLEELTQANGITHEAAHDALSDVQATIAIARLIKQRQPRLFDYLFQHRHKTQALGLLQVGTFMPLVHISGRYAARNNCLAVVVALAQHPSNANEIIVYDLACDPELLLELNAEQIRQCLFTAIDALPEGTNRIALKTVHINKCPVLAPLSVIKANDAERLQLDLGLSETHLQRISSAPSLVAKLAEVFTRSYPEVPNDPDLMLYSGGFFSNRDKNTMARIRQCKPLQLADLEADFDDPRLPEMLFRYRARNYPDTLSSTEVKDWQSHCRARLVEPDDSKLLSLSQLQARIAELAQEHGEQNPILIELRKFAASQVRRFG